jgi:DNA-binding PucR family transcriptional regulator
VSTIAEGVADFPAAYREAAAAVRFVGKDGGVAALTRLSPFEYLALSADTTARRLIDPRLQKFLREDRGRGGVLVATVRAYADADLSLKDAATRLHVHPNTAQ